MWNKPKRDYSRSIGAKLLSVGYREHLGQLVPEAIREELKLQEGSTWADAISVQIIKRAVGLVSKENICFTAITELREATEGKIAEKIISTQNEELLALAAAINTPPAPEISGDPTAVESTSGGAVDSEQAAG